MRLPQYRICKALMPRAGKRPVLGRTDLAIRAGYSPGAGTINRALHGVPKGSAYLDSHLGALDLGYIELLRIEIEAGIHETVYRITGKGETAVRKFTRRAPKKRDGAIHANHRYAK